MALQQITLCASKMPLDGHPEPFLNMPSTPPRRPGVRAPMISTLRTKVGVAARSVEMAALLCTAAAGWSVASAQGAVHEVGMYGDPFAAASYWRQQHTSDCGEMAVADVVGLLTGHEPAEQQMTALAETTPSTARPGPIWNPPAGTDIRDLPVLLAHYGIKADNIQTNIGALEQDLAERRWVIVILNAETIWNRPGKRDAANHFVVVTGIDPKAGVVHLNDSGTMNGRDEQIPIVTFEQAWAPNHNSAVVTL
ncbi:MAG: C39 family peptidase [Mycobacterium sp.]